MAESRPWLEIPQVALGSLREDKRARQQGYVSQPLGFARDDKSSILATEFDPTDSVEYRATPSLPCLRCEDGVADGGL
jgi:hypothetical protein